MSFINKKLDFEARIKEAQLLLYALHKEHEEFLCDTAEYVFETLEQAKPFLWHELHRRYEQDDSADVFTQEFSVHGVGKLKAKLTIGLRNEVTYKEIDEWG